MQFFISVIGILFTLLFVVGTHEFAHFMTARLLGVKVLRFSIGFGKTLFLWRSKKNTEYVLALIPLGGYVKMVDESEESVKPEDLPFAYNRQPFYKKFLIVLAGPLMNLFCALILYWIIFMTGFVTVKPLIGAIIPQSIAAKQGLMPNQEIISIDKTETRSWTGVIFRLLAHAGSKDSVEIEVQNIKNNRRTNHHLDLSTWNLNGLMPDPLASLGIVPYQPKIPLYIGMIAANSPAQGSKLKLGDTILAINNKPIQNWEEILTTILAHPEEILAFKIKRENKILTIPVKVGFQRTLLLQKRGYLGISPKFEWPPALLHKEKYSPLPAIARAWQEIGEFTYFNLLLMGKMLMGKVSLQSLGGPITIFESAGQALNFGFLSFISFLAFLSVTIGLINLLPIPGLDGGHLLVQMVEAMIGRAISERVLMLFYRLGFIVLFLLIFQAILNDILRIFIVR